MAEKTNRREGHDLIYRKLPPAGVGHWFSRFSQMTADITGSPWSFIIATALIVVWLVTGPLFNFSDSWQLVVNTGTTVATFLMVFLIQNTQNRDSRAIHLKLDELLRASPGARNEFMEAEEEDLDEIEREKAIVDKADPNPPRHKRAGNGKSVVKPSGNGKTRTP